MWGDDKVQIVLLLAVKKEDYSKDNAMRSFFKCLNNIISNKETLDNLIKENNVDRFLELIRDIAISGGVN